MTKIMGLNHRLSLRPSQDCLLEVGCDYFNSLKVPSTTYNQSTISSSNSRIRISSSNNQSTTSSSNSRIRISSSKSNNSRHNININIRI